MRRNLKKKENFRYCQHTLKSVKCDNTDREDSIRKTLTNALEFWEDLFHQSSKFPYLQCSAVAGEVRLQDLLRPH